MQTTVGAHNVDELEAIAAFAHETLAAKVWNLYFLVPTGRGAFVSDISPEAYDGVLDGLSRIQRAYAGRMLVNAKCAPHYVKTLIEQDPDSPFLKTYTGGAGGCPAGTHYLGIRPNGDVTPCPYLPVFGGNLRRESLAAVWADSEPFVAIRRRNELGGRCGACELNSHVRRLPCARLRRDRRRHGRGPALHAHAGPVRRLTADQDPGDRIRP